MTPHISTHDAAAMVSARTSLRGTLIQGHGRTASDKCENRICPQNPHNNTVSRINTIFTLLNMARTALLSLSQWRRVVTVPISLAIPPLHAKVLCRESQINSLNKKSISLASRLNVRSEASE